MKFKFKARVRVKSGFYEDVIAEVVEHEVITVLGEAGMGTRHLYRLDSINQAVREEDLEPWPNYENLEAESSHFTPNPSK